MKKDNSDTINKFLLMGNKFMPEMHLWDLKVKQYCAIHQKRIDMFIKDKF